MLSQLGEPNSHLQWILTWKNDCLSPKYLHYDPGQQQNYNYENNCYGNNVMVGVTTWGTVVKGLSIRKSAWKICISTELVFSDLTVCVIKTLWIKDPLRHQGRWGTSEGKGQRFIAAVLVGSIACDLWEMTTWRGLCSIRECSQASGRQLKHVIPFHPSV